MPRDPRDSAFLNIPYDDQYKNLYFAFIAGLCAFGLKPRAALEIATGERRLDRIFNLMTSCQYSFHDLSRVQLNRAVPRTPRFNMPFELGLLLGWQKTKQKTKRLGHTWFVFESVNRRLPKSLSDLDGTDPLIHGGTVRGVFRELSNALVKSRYSPNLYHMNNIYRHIKTASPLVMTSVGARSLFGARVFKRLVVLAMNYAELTVPRD
jgi:hypothetical protein